MDKNFLAPEFRSLLVSLTGGTVLAAAMRVMPFEAWAAVLTTIVVNLLIIKWMMQHSKSHKFLFVIQCLSTMVMLGGIYTLFVFYPNNFPLAGPYWKWIQTEIVDGGGASLLPVEKLSDNKIRLALDRGEEIQSPELYVNIGFAYPVTPEHWLLEVRQVEHFGDFQHGGKSITLSSALVAENRDMYVYLTNKPEMNRWVQISNYRRPFFKRIAK